MRLSEVYSLCEASVGNISRILGFSLPLQTFIGQLVGADKRFAFVMAKLFKGEMVRIGRWEELRQNDAEMKTTFHHWIFHHNVQALLKTLRHDPNYEKRLMGYDNVRAALDDLAMKDADTDELNSRAFLKLSNGFFWVKLQPDECPGEGRLMQHCGASGHDMFSLRDAKGQPHVTIDYDERENEVRQLRGKQNSFPDRKYWPAIAAFFKKTNAVLSDEYLDKHSSKMMGQFVDATHIIYAEPAAM